MSRIAIPLNSVDSADWYVYADNVEDYGGPISSEKCRRIAFVLEHWRTKAPGKWLLLSWRKCSYSDNGMFAWDAYTPYDLTKVKATEPKASTYNPFDRPCYTNPAEEQRCSFVPARGCWYDLRTTWKFFATIVAECAAKRLLTPDDFKTFCALPKTSKVKVARSWESERFHKEHVARMKQEHPRKQRA